MSAVHQLVPMIILVQFAVVLMAIVTAMLMADPNCSIPTRKSSRRAICRVIDGSQS